MKVHEVITELLKFPAGATVSFKNDPEGNDDKWTVCDVSLDEIGEVVLRNQKPGSDE